MNKRRLLIADDEESVSFPLRMYFERRGFDVDVAGNLDEARTKVDHTAYDVVITDLALTDQRGQEGLALAAHVQAVRPEAKTLLLTAGDVTALLASVDARTVASMMSKPISLSELAEAVSALLEP